MNEVKFAALVERDLLDVESTMQNALLTRNKMQDLFAEMYPEQNWPDRDQFNALLAQYNELKVELSGLIRVAAWQLDGTFEQARDMFIKNYWEARS